MKKKMLGALALSAVLAMGMAVPAFADPEAVVQGNATDNTSDTEFENTMDDQNKRTGVGTGNTDVYLQAVSNQVNATIPLKVYAVADIDGGDMVMPEKQYYKITNNSTAGELFVTKIVSNLETGWTGLDRNPADLASPAEKSVYMTLKADEAAAAYPVTSATATTTVNPTAPAKYLWSIAKKSGDAGTPSQIELVAANSALGSGFDTSMTYENGTAVKFMSIEYTVSMKAADLK